jgi:hypothetical protein
VGIVGGGVVKGATFLGRGLVSRFRSEKDLDEATDGAATPPIITAAPHNDEDSYTKLLASSQKKEKAISNFGVK